MINKEIYDFVDRIDKLQIIDSSAELQTILDCGGNLMLDIKSPDKNNLYITYVDSGMLKVSKVEVN